MNAEFKVFDKLLKELNRIKVALDDYASSREIFDKNYSSSEISTDFYCDRISNIINHLNIDLGVKFECATDIKSLIKLIDRLLDLIPNSKDKVKGND